MGKLVQNKKGAYRRPFLMIESILILQFDHLFIS